MAIVKQTATGLETLHDGRAYAAGQIHTAVNPPIVMTDGTASGVQIMRDMEAKVRTASSDTIALSITKANNGYVIQARTDVYVCMDMEALRDNIVRMVAAWEMVK